MRFTILSVVVALALVLMITACTKPQPPPAGTGTDTSNSGQQTGLAGSTSEGERVVETQGSTATGEQLETGANSPKTIDKVALPQGWPEDILLLTGYSINGFSANGLVFQADCAGGITLEDSFAFYSTLEGWEPLKDKWDTGRDFRKYVEYSKDGRILQIVITRLGNGTTIHLGTRPE